MTSIDYTKAGYTPKGTLRSPLCYLSYPKLHTSFHPMNDTTKPKRYAVDILIPAAHDISVLKEAAGKAATAMWGDKVPSKLKTPFLDGSYVRGFPDEPGRVLMRLWSKSRPEIRDGRNQLVDNADQTQVYGGREAVVTLNCKAYSEGGNKGVAFYLNNVQLHGPGLPIAMRVSSEEEFVSVESDKGLKPANASELF